MYIRARPGDMDTPPTGLYDLFTRDASYVPYFIRSKSHVGERRSEYRTFASS
jgi:hypothetical protein